LWLGLLVVSGCAAGVVNNADGPTVAEARAQLANGPKARIAVGQFLNNTSGIEAQMARMQMQALSQMPDTDAVMAYQEQVMNYNAELMRYQARLNEVGSDAAGPPPKAPTYPKAGSSPYTNSISDPVGGGLRDMMTNALFNSGRFIVLERQAIEHIDWEQGFSQSGRVGEKTTVPVGEIEGAELILMGSLNMLEKEASGGNVGGIVSKVMAAALPYGLGSTPSETTEADVTWKSAKAGMEIRVVDARTSRIVAATTVEGKSTDVGFGAKKTEYTFDAGQLPVGFSMYSNTPVEKAFRKMIDAAVVYILTKTPDTYYHVSE
jgi:curli biogenesis system outer membrane secretion channel CsgG